MPAGNPFAPVIEVGAQAGPVGGSASLGTGSLQIGDHHVAAGWVALGLLTLYILYKRKWRFSTQVG